jgi:hypothetical protein
MRPPAMNELNPTGHTGLAYIGLAILGKIINIFSDSAILQHASTLITLLGGFLAAAHYCVLLYDRFFKKTKNPS